MIALVVLAVAALAANLAAGHARFVAQFVNADALWTLAFFKDVIEQGGHVADWNVGQHADFFPDRLFAFAAYLVTSHHEDWFLAYAALNDLYFFAIAWYCPYVCRRLARGPANAAIAALLPAVLASGLPLFARADSFLPRARRACLSSSSRSIWRRRPSRAPRCRRSRDAWRRSAGTATSSLAWATTGTPIR